MLRPQLTVQPRWLRLSGLNQRGYRVRMVEQDDIVTLQLYHHQWLVGEGKGVSLSTTIFWLQDIAIANQVNRPMRLAWVMGWPGLWDQKPAAINYRGQGLGSVLLRALITYAREHAFQVIQGQVFQADLENTPYLLRWYQQHGFEILEAPEQDPPDVVARLWMNLTAAEVDRVAPLVSPNRPVLPCLDPGRTPNQE